MKITDKYNTIQQPYIEEINHLIPYSRNDACHCLGHADVFDSTIATKTLTEEFL